MSKLGYTQYNQTVQIISPPPKLEVTPKKGTSSALPPKKKTLETGVKKNNNPSLGNVTLNKQSTSRKRSLEPTLPRAKRSKQGSYVDPITRVIPVPDYSRKVKFSMPSLPVRNGSRDEHGKVKEAPLGGPYGLAEWLVDVIFFSKKNKVLLERKNFTSMDEALKTLKVLCVFIGLKSLPDLAYLVRVLDPKSFKQILAVEVSEGFPIIEKLFKVNLVDLGDLEPYTVFDSRQVFKPYKEQRALYKDLLVRNKELREQAAIRKSKVKETLSDDDMDITLSDGHDDLI
jgi:hypothetical protein